ncbi:MAG: hypothetical protein FJX77_04270 [Armatimonadetes bacterium]|nr:hypothetical protein [Armatimonadota bacterium]
MSSQQNRGPSPRPCPEARLLGPDDPAPEGATVWLYAGALQRFTGYGTRFQYRQRIAWPRPPELKEVQAFGIWMVERLSINGHLLFGLRARPDGGEQEAWIWIGASEEGRLE